METDVALSAADFAQARAISIWLWIAFLVLVQEIYVVVIRKIVDWLAWMETYSDFPKGSPQAAFYAVGMAIATRLSFIWIAQSVMG